MSRRVTNTASTVTSLNRLTSENFADAVGQLGLDLAAN